MKRIKTVELLKNNKSLMLHIKLLMQLGKVVLVQMMLLKLHTVLHIKLDREKLMIMFIIHKEIS